MPYKLKFYRLGADLPRNELGMTGSASPVLLYKSSRRSANSGNGTCIAAKTLSNHRPAGTQRSTRHTRLVCPSAAMMFSVPDNNISPQTMRGKAGQTSSLSLAGVSGVQYIQRQPRQRVDEDLDSNGQYHVNHVSSWLIVKASRRSDSV